MTASVLVRCAAAAAVLAAVSVGCGAEASNIRSRPISQADAEALLAQTVRLAQAGQWDDLCQAVAASQGVCEGQLQSVRDMGQVPGPTAPTVVGTDYADRVLVLHLTGTRADGSTYTADFAVVRRGDEGNLASITPVYWSGVNYGQFPAPTRPSESGVR